MTVVLEVTADFLLGEGITFGAEDLRFGLEHGIIRPGTVIDVATEAVRRGTDDPVMQELAALFHDEASRVSDVLAALDDPERIHDPRESTRKWLYVQLRAAYLARDRLADPLGVVEQVYADFDYPRSIVSFVRYMPLQPGAEAGERALMQRWADFLNKEHEVLAQQTS